MSDPNETSHDDPLHDVPLVLARAFAAHLGARARGGFGVRRHRDEWYLWHGNHFKPSTDEAVANAAYRFLNGLKVKGMDRKGKPSVYVMNPKKSVVANVLDALKSVAEVSSSVEVPSWMNDERTDPADWIVFQNGMLNISGYLREGETTLRPHTTLFFNTSVLPFDFRPGQECPQWLRFLNEVFEDDQERVELLQEWMGYCLTDETKYQKMMVAVGKPRSGKGTVLRMIEQLVGPQNCCSPRLSSLGNGFGLHAMLHARCALFGDARLGFRTDVDSVMENILRIVGEDPVDIERKHQDDIRSVHLRTKLTLAANYMPDLPDASVAIVARLLILPFDKSFVGHEDIHLQRKLNAELGGVLCWALEGLARLTEQGQFSKPKRSLEMADDLKYEISPIRHFIHDRLVTSETAGEHNVDPAHLLATVEQLWGQWAHWTKENGHQTGAKIGFGKKLNAAINGLTKVRSGDRSSRIWKYKGVAVRHDVAHLTTETRVDAGQEDPDTFFTA